jgi:hypothetical protein
VTQPALRRARDRIAGPGFDGPRAIPDAHCRLIVVSLIGLPKQNALAAIRQGGARRGCAIGQRSSSSLRSGFRRRRNRGIRVQFSHSLNPRASSELERVLAADPATVKKI